MGLFDKLSEPIFLKETSAAQEQLAQLHALLPECSGELRAQVERDIRNLEAGLYGEEQIAFELKNSHMPMYIIHDLFLEHNGLTAQIDYFLITRKMYILIECKNLFGNIEITNKGDFIRTTSYNGARSKEGIYSPITQGQRHLDLWKQIQNDRRGNVVTNFLHDRWFQDFNKSIVVLANPKTVLNDKYAKKETKQQIIRVDQLISHIKNMLANSKETQFSDKDMLENAERILSRGKENPKDYAEKYRVQIEAAQKCAPATNGAVPPIPEPSASERIPLCPRCGAPMVKRRAGRGENAGREFWGCTSYPRCRGIVNFEQNP